ncbi:hypothetical protein HPB50_029201 [Hyalomma asiaticum]|nr:hypothetical protein HPB50_029201 [Hyalomma asiaticum]
MLITSFLVVQVSQGLTVMASLRVRYQFNREGNHADESSDKDDKQRATMAAIENDTCPQRSFYVTGTITPSLQANGLGYINTARLQEPSVDLAAPTRGRCSSVLSRGAGWC